MSFEISKETNEFENGGTIKIAVVIAWFISLIDNFLACFSKWYDQAVCLADSLIIVPALNNVTVLASNTLQHHT